MLDSLSRNTFISPTPSTNWIRSIRKITRKCLRARPASEGRTSEGRGREATAGIGIKLSFRTLLRGVRLLERIRQIIRW
jgi:hypothetical protein